MDVDRLYLDLSGDGLSVLLHRASELPMPLGSTPMRWPLADAALKELRWYLEDYLTAPYGADAERGERVAGDLTAWGEEVFKAAFPTGSALKALEGLRSSARRVELVVRSAEPEWLSLPWELLSDPDRSKPLVLDGIGVDRSLPGQVGRVFEAEAGDRLRVLMVISRPSGLDDVGFQMVARPLLRCLDAVRGNVDLVVLRPPTLERLAEVLALQGPFHIVHFDGHGTLSETKGALLFETSAGTEDRVPAAKVAQILADAKVPVVVLNACQSGAIGREVEAAVATRLLSGGAASVVAMAYSVYAEAAAEFIAAFYERLFAGESVSAAVTAGRARLARNDLRPSPKGRLPLADWLVPVHYVRRDVRFPGLTVSQPDLSLDDALDRLHTQSGASNADLAPEGVFIGRDGLFYTLEAAARGSSPILLCGTGGTGKTELAKAFGRWWQDTNGVERPEWVFWHVMEPGIPTYGVDGIVGALGFQLFGTDFARVPLEQRQTLVLQTLRAHRALLIIDNFETVVAMPDPAMATPPLAAGEQERLSKFLREAASGASTVLITSRTREEWLGGVRRVEVPTLSQIEMAEYADELLKAYPSSRSRRASPAFLDLMRWLDGHPLSMRLVLPRLDTTDPSALLRELNGISGLDGVGEGRTSSLAASVTYSLRHLDPATADALMVLCLFHGVANAAVLTFMSGEERAPQRFAGIKVEQWLASLRRAVGVGLLTEMGVGLFRVHPALPAMLALRWRGQNPDGFDSEHSATLDALASAYGSFGQWLHAQLETGQAQVAMSLMGWQTHTMGAMLAHALRLRRWSTAQAIVQPLLEHLRSVGRVSEAEHWTDRILDALEGPEGVAPDAASEAGAVWLFATSIRAMRQLDLYREIDAAETTYRGILERVTDQPSDPKRDKLLAGGLHNLGRVAEEKEELAQAEDWYRQSLAMSESSDNKAFMGATYNQLGNLAVRRGRVAQAEEWFRKSLSVKEQLGNQTGVARAYYHLGLVAFDRGELDRADEWLHKSLVIGEQLGDKPHIASTYHQLGIVAHRRGTLDRADEWYRRSLTINEQLGDRASVSATYHQLGMAAQDRGDLDRAERWYRQSLDLKEKLAMWGGIALTYGQLGLLAEDRGNPLEALAWLIRSFVLLNARNLDTTAATGNLCRIADSLGPDVAARVWPEITGEPMPQDLRDFLDQEAP